MTLAEFKQIILKYKTSFPGQSIETRASEYFRYFKIYPLITVAEAIDKAVLEEGRAFFPSAGEINKYIIKSKQEFDERSLAQFKWISEAPKFQAEKYANIDTGEETVEYARYKLMEQANRYKSKGSDGYIYLIQNPDVWEWRIINGALAYIRPDPENTQIKYPQTKTYRG